MNTQPTVPKNRSPKEEYRASAYNQAKHRELISEPAFAAACHFALLEHERQIVAQANGNPNMAMAGFFRIQGAVEILDTLRNLADSATPTTTRSNNDNLNHQV